ncbi:hypothetical protein Bca4012_101642 [Brassica carinata]|uniref:Uncharacterized protein n=1 Tax=Brassica carinata TaxID=52824 RepID=A0A8X7PNM4_BRACI|nr:hypothetical protein Bca52824_084053 [Brassica carinata]
MGFRALARPLGGEARDIIHRMPSSAILLNSCHVNGNTEIGEWAAENLLETKPENPGYYMLIANRQLLVLGASLLKLGLSRKMLLGGLD